MKVSHPELHLSEAEIVRFWAKVNKGLGYGPHQDCWKWIGAHVPNGYGSFGLNRLHISQMGAHRLAYILQTGIQPQGLFVCHTCDVRDCVRGDHLFLGTTDDNMADMVRKGRSKGQPPGAAHHQAKLTEEEAFQIKHSTLTGVELCHIYNVCAAVVSQIRSGQRWKHLK